MKITACRSGDFLLAPCYTKAEIANLPSNLIYDNVREIALHMFDTVLTSWEPVSTQVFPKEL